MLITATLIILGSSFEIQPKIFKGRDTRRAQFPFFVYLETDLGNRTISVCGGSLINRSWVLTAAHCLVNKTEIDLHFGSYSRRNQNERGRVIMPVHQQDFIIHAGYEKRYFSNDIALIKLPQPIKFSQYIQPIKFARKCDLNEIFNTTVVGYGRDYTNGRLLNTLQYAHLQTTELVECMQTFPFLDYRLSIRCARGLREESACPGDSGGPLIDRNDNKLVAIVSFSTKAGCEDGLAQGFTSLASYHGWIARKTGLHIPGCKQLIY